ncbi:unnamed protein product [Haemonchus placei]|uniref:Saposin B-type domain-containing protein n=1 Tax=Haemonchus placei TaxID=6290 RepID=A0A0N4X508_HAEPC|nr:unnamed protein product [Haemonchus placei]
MILLILFSIFVYTNEKSISNLHEADDKAKPSDSLKNDAFDDFEVIPADYVCEFCLGVIKKLKERQSTEPDFEQNMKEECWKHNGTDCDDGNVCELINKVALDRLRNDEPEKICIDEKICPDKNKEIKEQQEKERKEKEQEANRKHEEEERKKAEEIEKLKTEVPPRA